MIISTLLSDKIRLIRLLLYRLVDTLSSSTYPAFPGGKNIIYIVGC